MLAYHSFTTYTINLPYNFIVSLIYLSLLLGKYSQAEIHLTGSLKLNIANYVNCLLKYVSLTWLMWLMHLMYLTHSLRAACVQSAQLILSLIYL